MSIDHPSPVERIERSVWIAGLIVDALEWDGAGNAAQAADVIAWARSAIDSWRATLPEPHGVATVYAGPSDLRDILWDALRQVTWIENADPSWQATYLRTLDATLTAAAERLAKP